MVLEHIRLPKGCGMLREVAAGYGMSRESTDVVTGDFGRSRSAILCCISSFSASQELRFRRNKSQMQDKSKYSKRCCDPGIKRSYNTGLRHRATAMDNLILFCYTPTASLPQRSSKSCFGQAQLFCGFNCVRAVGPGRLQE